MPPRGPPRARHSCWSRMINGRAHRAPHTHSCCQTAGPLADTCLRTRWGGGSAHVTMRMPCDRRTRAWSAVRAVTWSARASPRAGATERGTEFFSPFLGSSASCPRILLRLASAGHASSLQPGRGPFLGRGITRPRTNVGCLKFEAQKAGDGWREGVVLLEVRRPRRVHCGRN